MNDAVLGEVRDGSAKQCDNAIYITIGTGIVGAFELVRVVNGD